MNELDVKCKLTLNKNHIDSYMMVRKVIKFEIHLKKKSLELGLADDICIRYMSWKGILRELN